MEHINLFVNNQYCFDNEIYSLIIQKLNLNLKSEIIDIIDIVTKNKYKFRESNNLENYNLIINRLVSVLEKHHDNEKIIYIPKLEKNFYEVIESINEFYDLKNSPYLNVVIEKLPLLKACFDNIKKMIDCKLQLEPIINNNYDKNNVIKVVKFLLSIFSSSTGKINKLYICITIFDFIFRNFNIVKQHKPFALVLKNKLIELLNDNKHDIKDILFQNNLEENTFEIWNNIMNENVKE
jgi:hypothetical protein